MVNEKIYIPVSTEQLLVINIMIVILNYPISEAIYTLEQLTFTNYFIGYVYH